MQVSATGFAQRISIEERNTAISVILMKIQQQSGYDIFYKNKLVKDEKINISLKDVTVETALKAVLDKQELEFSIDDKLITIQKKTPSFLERVVDRWAAIDVHGRVVDQEGKPLPGATVKVKLTGKSVSANAKGEFYLEKVEEGTLLVVSFIGYLNKELIAQKALGDIALELNDSKLDEVQVIAYGEVKKKYLTSNIGSISGEQISKQPVTNPLLALQGRVPGLFVNQNSGLTGNGIDVTVQGRNSIGYGNLPFYVIDGVPYSPEVIQTGVRNISSGVGTTLGFINPSEIESIR